MVTQTLSSPTHPSPTLTKPINAPILTPDGWPAQGQWRYEDYVRLPDDGRRYEIIQGVLYGANAPSVEHQYSVAEISFHIKLFVREHNVGQVYTSPLEVHLSETTRPVQPDILFIRANRQPPIGTRAIENVPDLIVEVISPSSIRLDRHIKFDLYESTGVQEYWLVDTHARLVEVYTLSGGEYALFGQYTGDEMVESALLVGLRIPARSLFQPAG